MSQRFSLSYQLLPIYSSSEWCKKIFVTQSYVSKWPAHSRDPMSSRFSLYAEHAEKGCVTSRVLFHACFHNYLIVCFSSLSNSIWFIPCIFPSLSRKLIWNPFDLHVCWSAHVVLNSNPARLLRTLFPFALRANTPLSTLLPQRHAFCIPR